MNTQPHGCVCQQFGKSGVPYPSGKCMVCGQPVSLDGLVIRATDPRDEHDSPIDHDVEDL